VTNQRMLVLRLMAERPGQHLTAEEIYDLARQICQEIGLATIYRTVQVLVGLLIIDKICSRFGEVFSFQGDLLDTLEQALLDRSVFFDRS
jgi:Fur family ferric uptake transcriptional regulator